MKIRNEELAGLIKKVLQKKFSEAESNLISEVIMFGELSGKTSHGVVRLENVVNKKITGKPTVVKKTKTSVLIEGHGNSGILIAQLATSEVIKLAKENGMGIVGTRGTFSSSGSLSYYLEKIAKEGLIGIIMAESPEGVPPHGSTQPLFGTNPISFGIPADPSPLLFDMATSAISYGAILKAKALGQSLPENVAIDSEGVPTTNPEQALTGAILPFDNSYKGAGLAMIVEILAGILPGATFAIHNKEAGWGNLFFAFSPNLLMEEGMFKDKVHILRETIRNAKTKTGVKVRIPGEKTIETRDTNLKKGWIDVDEKLITLIESL